MNAAPRVWLRSAAAGILLLPAAAASAQGVAPPTLDELRGVLPAAARFSPKQGRPPVFEGYAEDPADGRETLVGYAFLTSDVPPEAIGYNGPIRVLVGMDLEGILTGVRVVAYHESLQKSRGDFLSLPGFQDQFAGKAIADPFRVERDVDGVTGATITVDAMALGIRNAARRVAAAHLNGKPATGAEGTARYIGTIAVEELAALSWAEMLEAGLARQVAGEDVAVSLTYLREPAVGEMLLGSARFGEGLARAGDRAPERHLMAVGIDGSRALGPVPRLFFAQGGDTIRVAPDDFVDVGAVAEGKLEGVFRRPGLLLADRALDVTTRFTIGLERCCGQEPVTTEYVLQEPVGAVASRPADDPAAPAAAGTPRGAIPATEPAGGADPVQAAEPTASTPPTPGPPDPVAALLVREEVEDESVLARALERTSWPRVAAILLLLALASWAFAAKQPGPRWLTLTLTLLFLGFVDGSFLSVSHIISGLTVGPAVFLADVPLLLMVVFAAATTLLWGRVFCGFLCPFGALQDFIERVVPKRLQRHPRGAVHRRAALTKYLVLALVLAPAALGAEVSLFQYFEPFGTVFFRSRSALLWLLAVAVLAASAVVPRFYCRYACPLGAALALGSLLAPFRIRRVEQCGVCKVCEQACPTGAIRGDRVAFEECVRCNVCESRLRTRAGTCRHDMEAIRPRLVQLGTSARGARGHGGIPVG